MGTVDLGPREVRFPPGGELRRASIDPSQFVAARLVAELADGWKGYCETMALSPGSTANRTPAIRSVGRFLTSRGDRLLSLTDPATTTLARLHAWESSLLKKYPPPSERAKDLGEYVRRFVRYFLASHRVDASPLGKWAASPILDSSLPSAQPLDEFSNRERLLLQRHMREIVRKGEQRLVFGDSMLAAGVDPRVHGWDALENLVWAMRHLQPTQRDRRLEDALADQRIIERVLAATGMSIDSYCPQVVMGHLLTPSVQHLAALRVLIHMQTGWSPEETKWLTRNDVEFLDGEVRVHTTKNRAQRRRSHILPSRGTDDALGWKAGDLFRRAQFVMRHAHAMSAEQDWFWTAAGKHSTTGVRVTSNFSLRRCTFNAASSLGALIRTNNIEISEPFDMRRIRKTFKSAQAVLLGTLHGAAGADHSVEVFRDHYLPTTTVNTVAAQTVIRAQNKVLQRATTGPTLITTRAAEIASAAPQEPIGQLAASVANESQAEREMEVAACIDPYRPPHLAEPVLCMDAPSMCLRCPNAVIFADHLPRLILYAGVLQGLQNSLPPQQFHHLYGQQLGNLQHVIDSFPADDVEAARAHTGKLHLPLSERHHHR